MLHRFGKISIFGRMEKFIVLTPVFLLLLSAFEIFFLNLPGNKSVLLLSFIVGDVLLFNLVHVVLTFPMMMHLPELKSFRREYDLAKSIPFWLHTAAVYVFFLVYFTLLQKYAGPFLARGPGSWIFYATIAAVMLVSFMPAKHNLFQIKGFGIVYRQLASGGQPPSAEQRALQLREKMLFNALLLFLTLQIFAVGEEQRKLRAIAHATLWKELFFAGAFGIALWIVIDAFRSDRVTQRPLYMIRVLLWPLTAFSYISIIGMKGFHGLEYLAYYLRAPEGSASDARAKRRYYLLGATLFLLMFAGQAALAYMAYFHPDWLRSNLLGPAAYAALQSVVYAHFFMDHELYQMSRPSNRRLVGPILYPAELPSRAPTPGMI